MARWLSFFAEYNFVVHYKPGKNNILADALSRRPDHDPRRLTRFQRDPDNDDDDEDCAVCMELGINATVSSPVLPLRQQIADVYDDDAFYAGIIRYLRNPTADALAKLTRPTRDCITRYYLNGDLLTYAIDTFDTPRVVIPADDYLLARLGHALHGVVYEELSAVAAAMPAASTVPNFAPKPTPTSIDSATVSELLLHRQAVTRYVRDALQAAADQQKANADRRGDRVLLSTDGIQGSSVTNLGANKLELRFIGPFKILKVVGDAYTLDIPTSMRLYPTFYVGRLKPYAPATIPALAADRLQPARPQAPRPQWPHPQPPQPPRSPSVPADDADAASARALAPHARAGPSEVSRRQDSPDGEAAPSSRAVPAPTGPRQLQLPRHAGAQTGQSSELPSRHPSLATTRQPQYQRDRPPPLVDASGARRWIVETLVDHDVRANREAPPRGTASATNNRASRHQVREKHYRVRWLGYSPAEDTWEPRSRLLQDVPDLVNDYEASLAPVSASDYAASLALVNANDCDAMTRAQDSATDCECASARGSPDVRPPESPHPQDLCEHARNDRSSNAHHRSAVIASVGAPIPLALAGCDSGTWSNLPPSARSTSATLAPPSRTRAHEDPQ
ncbi:unnamed protein product [Phytophthora fragariaefolia]|uniref:Unnamed protein product n=1 Tax=Phytophthora fragariaefolia TaxID=1490495 RepID=A0A9W7CWV4_9STRA|nr:unnamed protein product [Phytophthora fragariaefolia]